MLTRNECYFELMTSKIRPYVSTSVVEVDIKANSINKSKPKILCCYCHELFTTRILRRAHEEKCEIIEENENA